MSSVVRSFFSCISGCGGRVTVKDKLPTREQVLPLQMKQLIIHLVLTGLQSPDLFRRPGNTLQVSKLVSELKRASHSLGIGNHHGAATQPTIVWSEYNPYTLANALKRYLLSVQGGLFSEAVELELIQTLQIDADWDRWQAMRKIMDSQSASVRDLASMVLGVWFLTVYHQHNPLENQLRSLEGIAKSVAGSLFPNCVNSPEEVELASKVTENLISSMACAHVLDVHLIRSFVKLTNTAIVRVEKHTIEMHCPLQLSNEKCRQLMKQHVRDVASKYRFREDLDEVCWDDYQQFDINSVPIGGVGGGGVAVVSIVGRQLLEFVTLISVSTPQVEDVTAAAANGTGARIHRPAIHSERPTSLNGNITAGPTTLGGSRTPHETPRQQQTGRVLHSAAASPQSHFQSEWPPKHWVAGDNEESLLVNTTHSSQVVTLEHDYDDVAADFPTPLVPLSTPPTAEPASASSAGESYLQYDNFDYDDVHVPGADGKYKILSRWFIAIEIFNETLCGSALPPSRGGDGQA